MSGLRWSEQQLAEFESRRLQGVGKFDRVISDRCEEVDPGPESDLQNKIEKYCEEHGYLFFHDRSRGKNEPGFPDLVIAMPEGRTLWLECKSKTGRMSDDQKRWRLMLLYMKHEHHQVKSYRVFLKIVGKLPCWNQKPSGLIEK